MMEEVTVKKNRSEAITVTVLSTVIAVWAGFDLLTKKVAEDPAERKAATFYFLCGLLFALICGLVILDNAPVYKISQEGIQIRKKILSKKFNQVVKWSDIEYFFVEMVINARTRTETLMIKSNSREKYFKLTLTRIGEQKEKVLNFMKEKAVEYHFHDLLTEANESSRY